ncbi:hypothetical protein [Prevotella sp. tc2-28]|uniref:hypothetical protein n=1 Tax=Prevotella sp. tc2-28 TaxID=1761888 RepID=UPI00115FAEBB|nr:hypothetical protein [Prevotella sp. tc2-28]
MKTKNRSYFLSAVLIGIAMLMTGCAKEDIASNDNGGGTNPTDVNVDELNVKVTADVPTAVLSSFDEKSMGGALVRRLSKTTSSLDAGTKMVLIKGEDILNRPLTEWLEAAKIYLTGGYIAIEKPHNAHLVQVLEQLSAHFEQATYDILTKDDGSGVVVNIVPPNTLTSSNTINADAAKMKTRITNINALAATRSGVGEADAVAEMVIFSRMGYYQCAPYGTRTITYTVTNKDGSNSTKTKTITQEYDQCSSGYLADGAASWLNNRDAAQQVRRASNRADGGDAINSLMSASEEHTYQNALAAVLVNKDKDGNKILEVNNPLKKDNAYQEIIRVWGVHNMETNKDYYYTEQKVVASVGGKREGDDLWNASKTLYRGPYNNDKWIGVEKGRYSDPDNTLGFDFSEMEEEMKLAMGIYGDYIGCAVYGAWFNKGDFSLNLTGKGSIQLEDAVPDTDNNNISRSVAVGTTESETNTIGGTFSPGFVGSNPSGALGLNFSHGWTTGTSYTLTTTENAKELKCVKNTEGNKVKWTYECGKTDMGDIDKGNATHAIAPDALTSDVNIDNQACWSVANPEGAYTLETYHMPTMCSLVASCTDGDDDFSEPLFLLGDSKLCSTSSTDANNNTVSYTLQTPNRAKQTWTMDVDFPELGQDGYKGVKDELTDALKTQFPNLYQPTIVLADQTPESENTIQRLVDTSKKMLNDPNALQTLRGYALDRGVSQFTIKWYCADGNHPNPYTMTITAK